jgi:Arc/MetJ-type ribon-helix-helix transcriptional regulator
VSKKEVYITVKLPKTLVDEILDPLVGAHGYSSRTEAIKDGLRRLSEKYQKTICREA